MYREMYPVVCISRWRGCRILLLRAGGIDRPAINYNENRQKYRLEKVEENRDADLGDGCRGGLALCVMESGAKRRLDTVESSPDG